jgi:small subunit ribosomal protein S16
MATKLRLQRHGRKRRPFYYIVVADARSPRDGRFIERIGTYDPVHVPAQIDLDVNKSIEWLNKGAQPTKTVRAILKYKGAMYKKHLLRGVSKGAFSMDEAERLFSQWTAQHESKISEAGRKAKNSVVLAREAQIQKVKEEREAAAKAAAQAEAEAKAAEEAAAASALAAEQATAEAGDASASEEGAAAAAEPTEEA